MIVTLEMKNFDPPDTTPGPAIQLENDTTPLVAFSPQIWGAA